jgi:hypothetical protein
MDGVDPEPNDDCGTSITGGHNMAASSDDRLFAEVDRQLTEARMMADGLATRAGVLVSGSALVAGLLGTRLPMLQLGWAVAALVGLGIATVLGALVLVPGLVLGPMPVTLSAWLGQDPERSLKELYGAKVLALEGNATRLARMRVLFYFQTGSVVVAVGLAIVAALWR